MDRGDNRLTHWLEDIYRDHRRGLFGLALSVVREAATAEDAVHEAFARLARQKGPPDGDATAYVYKAVRNAAIDQARRRKARPTPTDDIASLFENMIVENTTTVDVPWGKACLAATRSRLETDHIGFFTFLPTNGEFYFFVAARFSEGDSVASDGIHQLMQCWEKR